jgi:hypothetical protein
MHIKTVQSPYLVILCRDGEDVVILKQGAFDGFIPLVGTL